MDDPVTTVVRCYRVYVDDVPKGDKMNLDSALIFIRALCDAYGNDTFTIKLEQMQAIVTVGGNDGN